MQRFKKLLNKAQQAVECSDEEMRMRVDMVAVQVDYVRLYRTPKEAKADGTYDWVWGFVRKHNIRIHEMQDIEKTIRLYDENYLDK